MVEYIDAESYMPKQDATNFRSILLDHLKNLAKLGSVELRQGTTQMLMSAPGVFTPVYVPGTEEAFINAVQTLENLLYPYLDKKNLLIAESFEAMQVEIAKKARSKAAHLGNSHRWPEIYNKNLSRVSWRKFRWLSTVLKELGYLDAGELHEDAGI